MEFLSDYAVVDLFWIALSLFLTAMSKGGFPVGGIALPVLILMWPSQTSAARSAVSFMLPMLCLMDCVALSFYWKHVKWGRLIYLMPAMLLGVGLASYLFISDTALVSVSDTALKLLIGILGIVFVIYFATKKWILRHIHAEQPFWGKGSLFGFGAGVTSTLAHAAGPVMQMYLLPQQLDKKSFAATSCAFFWVMNLVKLGSFVLLGRIEAEQLKLGAVMVPLLPIGVFLGWWLTRKTDQKYYTSLIYVVLLITSITLILKAL